MRRILILVATVFTIQLLFTGTLQAQTVPFTVQSGLFNQANTNTLGLSAAPGTATFTIFKPTAATDHYGNGVALIGFKGYLYCQWQSSPTNEDSPDTWVAYSRSKDGMTWTAPMVLAANPGDGERTSGGWWVYGNTLVAYINHYPTALSPRGGYTEYITSTNGLNWTPLQRLTMTNGVYLNGIFEQDPHALPGGRIINAAHFQPGLICSPIYTDDPSGLTNWVRPAFTNLAYSGSSTRELEPSWFYRSDGAVVMIFRDQNNTRFKLASVSTNFGQTWTIAALTTMPDSGAKQSAGNLPDGTAYMVNNPVTNKIRIPLALTLSKNGSLFDKAYLLRAGGTNLEAQVYPGTSKGLGYSYPKCTLWNGYLYAGYSVNKEDIACTRVPVTSIQNVGLGAPMVIEAEVGAYGGGVTIDNNNAGFNGIGFANFPSSGGYLQFNTIDGGVGGSATLITRYALGGGSSRTGTLTINGATQSITFDPTVLWTTWVLMTNNIALGAGTTNVISFQSTGADLGDIDEITIIPTDTTNTAPVLPVISNRTINAGVNLLITNTATDSDKLTYALPTAPTNATLDAGSGILNWRPLVTQANTTNPFSVVVTDNGSPSMSATQSFNVIVNPLIQPSITAPLLGAGQVGFTINGQAGPDYAVQASSNLINWNTVFITNSPAMPFSWSTNVGAMPVQFYRIKTGPPLP